MQKFKHGDMNQRTFSAFVKTTREVLDRLLQAPVTFAHAPESPWFVEGREEVEMRGTIEGIQLDESEIIDGGVNLNIASNVIQLINLSLVSCGFANVRPLMERIRCSCLFAAEEGGSLTLDKDRYQRESLAVCRRPDVFSVGGICGLHFVEDVGVMAFDVKAKLGQIDDAVLSSCATHLYKCEIEKRFRIKGKCGLANRLVV